MLLTDRAICLDCETEMSRESDKWFVCTKCNEHFHVDEICDNCSHNFVYRQVELDAYERRCKCRFIEEV